VASGSPINKGDSCRTSRQASFPSLELMLRPDPVFVLEVEANEVG